MHILHTRKFVCICAVTILLSSASAYAFEKPMNNADCDRIVAEIGWKLENPTMWPQYGVCDATPPETGAHLQDMKIALRVPSYDGLTLLSMAETSRNSREVLASFVRTREGAHDPLPRPAAGAAAPAADAAAGLLWLDERM